MMSRLRIDGEQLLPRSTEELADVLREASAQMRTLVPWGAGTLQHLGAPAAPSAIPLVTTSLNRIIEYTPADLTVTLEAGVTLADLQATLHRHAQWLPWEPPAPPHATIGGLLAAGVSGPLRLGYGTPRDWTLGMRVVLGDGRLMKSGGKVVKNVAGYEAHKLHLGALGTLGVIAEVTFKLAPLPERLESLVFDCPSLQDAIQLAEQLRIPPLAPVSLALLSPATQHLIAVVDRQMEGWRLVARFGGVAAAVERQLDRASVSGGKLPGCRLSQEQSQVIWNTIALFPAPTSNPRREAAVLIRAGAPLARLTRLLEMLVGTSFATDQQVEVVGYAGVGLAYARCPLPASRESAPIAQALGELQAKLAQQHGYAVVEDAPEWLQIDRWGPVSETLPLMRSLKHQWDPKRVLSPGRYAGAL